MMAKARSQAVLDPRTKVLLVIATSAVVLSVGGRAFILPGLALAIGLALWEGARMRAAGIAAAAALTWALGWLLPGSWPNPVTGIVSITAVYLIGFVVAVGIGMHVLATTSPTQLSVALRAWRVPRPIAVTLTIVLRFFPIVAAESRAVLDAMRLRGLTGTRGFLRHPILSIERFVVPMIAASLRASDDLSASAILRGLGSHRTPTAMNAPRFGRTDLAVAVIVTVLTTLALVAPNPLA